MFRSLSTAVLLLLLALPGVALAQGTGTIAGRVLEADGVTAIIGANVRVGGTTLGAATDLDGNYRIIGVPVGSYDVTASYTGFPSVTVTGAEINAGSTRQLNFTLASGDNTTGVVDIVYVAPLITNDAIGQSRVATGSELENLPIRGVAQTVALQAGGVVSSDGSSDLNIRGGRSEEVQYFVDGVRVSGLLGVNQQAIEQQEVIIGTIPARYGDVQSGVISITTKTGSDRFFGSAEGVTSTGLDSYGYNLGSLSLGGPVVPGRVGFFLSGELQSTEDSNPFGKSTYRLRDDIYADLQQRPQSIQVRDIGSTSTTSTSYIPFPAELITGPGITRDSLEAILRNNNVLSATQELVPGAGLIDRAETFTADSFDLVKGKRDPLDAITLNGSLNFTFGDIGLRLGGGYATSDRSVYSFTSSLYNRDAYNRTERDNYRLYGTLRQRLSQSAFYQIQGEFQDFRFVQYPNGFSSNIEDVLLYGDSQAPQNVVASRYYTIAGTAASAFSQNYNADGGPRPSQLPGGTFSSAGRTNITNFQKAHDQRYRFSGSATAQVGVNQIEFGGEYQQDTRRFFSIAGFSLAAFVDDSAVDPNGGQRVGEQYPNGITSYDQFDFETLRRRTTRYGYDYLGLNEVNDQSIDGYFKDEQGNRSNTNLAPYSPVYYAGYIQDKIEFQDLVVQLGLRVEAFDNNTDVLLDLYAPTPIFRANSLTTGRPAGIDDDYAVYYNASDVVVGFRDLDGNFYDTQGTRTSDTAIIRDARGQVRSDGDAPRSSAFRPYQTQVNVVPRVGVSFPVTDRALFFASYSVLTQRPTENAVAPLSSYEELDGQTRVNNPNLLPERSTQYELGFRQRLGERAAVSLSGFYRTQENKISVRNAVGGFPQYSTYFNADFTTTQGAEVNFDLRRTNNLQINANYTLSFAQGTGSDANATATAAWRGDFFPQTISPADFDQRHTANVTMDYRLAKGDGPLIGGIRPFENFGINLIGQFGSGQRYTRLKQNNITFVSDSFTPDVSGTLNGSTLPASTRFDLRVDRAFDLGFRAAKMRAYVQVQNLFDTRNRLAVYRATGQSDEDGFATSTGGQQLLTTPGLLFNYDAFTSGPLNVGGNQSSAAGSFYSAPRQVRLGFLFDF